MINADVEGQLLGSDAQVGLDAAVELSTRNVKILGNCHERYMTLRHVLGHSLTELSDECVMIFACEHCNIVVVNDIAKFAINRLFHYAKWCIVLA